MANFIALFTYFVLHLVGVYSYLNYALSSDNITRYSISNSSFKRSLHKTSFVLAKKIQEVVTNELGAATARELNSVSRMRHQQPSDDHILSKLSEKLSAKITTATDLLAEMRKFISTDNETLSFTHPCPLNSLRNTAYIKSALSNLSDKEKSILVLSHENKVAFRWSGRYKNLKIKRQYFVSTADSASDKDCSLMSQSNLQQLYHKIYYPERKNVIIIFDNNINHLNFHKAVLLVRETVSILQTTDRIALITTTDSEFLEFSDTCDEYKIISNSTEENKAVLLEFISRLQTSEMPSNYTRSIGRIFSMLPPLPELRSEITLLLFISDKMKLQESELKMVQKKSELLNLRDKFQFIMSIVHSEDPFNSRKNQSSLSFSILPFVGNTTAAEVVSKFYTKFRKTYYNGILAMMPYWDPTQRDFMVSLLLQAGSQGILGVDLYLTDIAEDIIYFKRSNSQRRAFILDKNGYVLMHSYFPRAEFSVEKIKFTDLIYVENYEHIDFVKRNILSNNTGKLSVTLNSGNTLNYIWKWVKNLYVVCIVVENNNMYKNVNATDKYSARVARDLLYHRLDLFPPKNGNLCRHFKQIAVIEEGTFYLSPSSFQSPFSYLHDFKEGQDSTINSIQTYLAYLKDTTSILSNPGLKDDVRNHVGVLHSILSYFKTQSIHGLYNRYIVRRYAVTESGVLAMFPGTVLEHDYEPIRRPWYTTAIARPGKIILTPPNLDMGGAGYIVSLSYAVINANEYPSTVLSMDVTMGFLYKMLIDNFSYCTNANVKCFIMNDKGYLISHPGLMDPNSSGPVEQQHITHKESLIASDMLNHKGFVTKRICNNFSDRTIQRFYEFNTSLDSVLSNVIHGDHCVQYYITSIPGTNAFVGVVNATCELGAFCPCSMDDRLCLNCNRMEQNECECPCECSSASETCNKGNEINITTDLPLCGPSPEKHHLKSHYFYNFAENLKPCFDFQCESYDSYSSCLGILGCEWCQLDTDGETPLSMPICTSLSLCFNGVLGAVTPYGEGTFGHVTSDDILGTYSAIGPVAGCIVTVCLIVAISIYCYKQNVSSASCRDLFAEGGAESWPERDLQLSHLPSDDNMHVDHSGQDKLLPAMEAEAPISPYRVVTGYKRPNTTGDSDHGYSTMTPHEDSEHMAFSMTEPIVSLDDSDGCLTSNRPNINPQRLKILDPSVTVLPCGKNNVIAAVTVHRHMETT